MTIEERAQVLVGKLPDFDPTWPAETQMVWFEAFLRVMDMVSTSLFGGVIASATHIPDDTPVGASQAPPQTPE